MALLELHDIVAGYVREIHILNGVRLAAEAGSITGIIGANGAGKSTLLRMIFGFLHPFEGRILFNEREIRALAPHDVKRSGIGYVPQATNIFPHLTVHENLQLGAWIFRRDTARMAEMLAHAYDAFPRLAQKRLAKATTLSGGEARMLSIAKEIVTDPRLLLVDEPSAGLSPKVSDEAYEQLVKARARGLTILLVDQNIAKAVEVSDYLYVLQMGRVRHHGPREQFSGQIREIIRDSLLGA